MNIKQLGQVFTPDSVVEAMLGLRQNFGRVLEPSAGDGAFLSRLESSATGIEIDSRLALDSRIICGDFFAYSTEHKFDTVIGNPPYVRFRDIRPETRSLVPMGLFDSRTNLYLFFIAKCIEHLEVGGELIFITPRDFIKSTNAVRLNRVLYERGAMTYFEDLGDSRIFSGFSPNCAIWRWEKGAEAGGSFHYGSGQIWFGAGRGETVGDYFSVKVGAVSGADDIFASDEHGTLDMVCSSTHADGRTRRVIYNEPSAYLLPYKERLLGRRIRRFTESNWWEWGRGYPHKDGKRIYVNCKTRQSNPFFVSEVSAYDGSVLGLFPREGVCVDRAVKKLNLVDWGGLGFVSGGRLLLSQRSLEHAAVGSLQ